VLGAVPDLPAFLEQRVFAILRASDGALVADAIDAVVGAGMHTVEVTLTTPGAEQAISEARRRHGDRVHVGAGTVLDERDVRRAVDAGAAFCVSPIVDVAMIEACVRAGVPAVPGTATPTEMVAATRAGATACKVFPSRPDGPSFIRQILAPLPDLVLVPTGGVEIGEVRAYLDATAAAVGLGSSLLVDALRTGDMRALADRAAAVLGAVR